MYSPKMINIYKKEGNILQRQFLNESVLQYYSHSLLTTFDDYQVC